MLQHMIEAQILDLVLRSMDLLVRVLEVRLNDESRWIASLRSTSMIGACIAAPGKDVRDIAVLVEALVRN